MNLNHLHLHVADVERAARFYEGLFGMRRHVWHGEILFLRDEAGMDLALAPGDVVPFPQWHHFGFRAGSAVEVEALLGRAQEAGAPIVQALIREDDFASFRLADPDGYRIEVYWDA